MKVTYTYGCIILCMRGVLNCIFGIYLSYPDNFDEIVFHFVGAIPSLLNGLKLIVFVVYHRQIANLFVIIKEKFWFTNSNCSENEKEIILRYINYARLCSLIESVALVCAGLLWLARPVVEMFFLKRNPNESFKKKLPFMLEYPYIDVYSEPWYEIEFFVQIIQDAAIVAGSCAMGGVYYHLILNVCAQFKLIQVRLKNFNKGNGEIISSATEQERNLNKCIKLHQDTLNFCAEVNITMKIALFVECLSITLFVCTSAFIATMGAGSLNVLLLSLFCVIAASAEIFLYCALGSLLTTEGLKVAHAAYESDWYNSPIGIQKKIMYIIARGQKPVFLTGGDIIPISVETFEKVIRTSVSYFTVLNSMND